MRDGLAGMSRSGWSWEENKRFEVALAMVEEGDPRRWEKIAAKVGGGKSAEDVHKHYAILLEDLDLIQSGDLDHRLLEGATSDQSRVRTDYQNVFSSFKKLSEFST